MSADKIAVLISKLKAHEQSARNIGNQAEAEAFAAKIAQLLTEHKLSMSEVEYQAQEQENPFVQVKSSKRGGSSVPESSLHLARAIANYTFTKTFVMSGINQMMFVGRKVDAETARDLYDMLKLLAWSLSQKEWRRYKVTLPYDHPHKNDKFHTGPYAIAWAKSFLEGFSVGVSNKMNAASNATKIGATSQANALILRDATALVEYIENTMRVGHARSRKDVGTNAGAFAAGKQHGENAQLRRPSNLRLGNGR